MNNKEKLSRSELVTFIAKYTGLTREQVHGRIKKIMFLYTTNPKTRKKEYSLSVNMDKIENLKRKEMRKLER
jgi:hypothetical protein